MSVQKAEAKQPAAIDLEKQNRQLQLQILQLTEQAKTLASEKEALESLVAKQKAAMKVGKEKITELLKANEEFSRVNQSFEASFSEDSSTPKKLGSAQGQEDQMANRDRRSAKALRERKGTCPCPKVVEENALAAVAASVVAAAGAFVTYKKYF